MVVCFLHKQSVVLGLVWNGQVFSFKRGFVLGYLFFLFLPSDYEEAGIKIDHKE